MSTALSLVPFTEERMQQVLRRSEELNEMSREVAHGLSLIKTSIARSSVERFNRWPGISNWGWEPYRRFTDENGDSFCVNIRKDPQNRGHAILQSISYSDGDVTTTVWENGQYKLDVRYVRPVRRGLPRLMGQLAIRIPELTNLLRFFLEE